MDFDYAIFVDGMSAVLVAHFTLLVAVLCGVVSLNWLFMRE